MLKTYNKFGPNPNVKETKDNADFIDYLRKFDVEKSKKNIFSICARCYPDWIKEHVNPQNEILDENAEEIFGIAFDAMKPPKNMVSNTTGVSNTSLDSCIEQQFSFFTFMTGVVNGNESMMIGFMKKYFKMISVI